MDKTIGVLQMNTVGVLQLLDFRQIIFVQNMGISMV